MVEQSDPAVIERITVNFIRRELTEYDESLEKVAGRMGVDEATAMMRSRVSAREYASIPTILRSASGRDGSVMGRHPDATR